MRIQCGSCETQYDLSKEHEPLAGRQFPCSKCQGKVAVPALPWDSAPKKPPSPPEQPAEHKHLTISVSCGNCLEDYNVSSDDGLEGMAFPCDTCGQDVTVPSLPWDEYVTPDEPFDQEAFELTESFRNLDLEIPEERALEPIDGALSVTISCENCLEEYNVSAEDGLAGMGFPCDNCGQDVAVPPHPWPEIEEALSGEFDDLDFTSGVGSPTSDDGGEGIELPSEKEFVPIEGGQTINLTCENCLEEYNLSADDGLAGMEFPCETCGEDVGVPPHPWPEVQEVEEEEYPDDFLDAGTPIDPKGKEESVESAEGPGLELPEEREIAPIEGGLTINLTCENCLEEYNLSADDGLAGMEFPCETCGEDVTVPPHPWPEVVEEEEEYPDDFLDAGTPVEAKPADKPAEAPKEPKEKPPEESVSIEVPEERELPPLEGHDKCTITCENCLEEYNLNADDGLAGLEFPCEVCGESVDVPPHPWPEPDPEEVEEDFLDVGAPVENEPVEEETEEETAEKTKPEKKKKKKKKAKGDEKKSKEPAEADSGPPSSKGSKGGDGLRLVPKMVDPLPGEEEPAEEPGSLAEEDGPEEEGPEEAPTEEPPEKRPKAAGKGKKRKARKPSKKAIRSAALPGDLPSRRISSAMAESALPDEAFEEDAEPLEEGVSTGPQTEVKAKKKPRRVPKKAKKGKKEKSVRRPSATAKSSAREAHKQLPPSRGVHIPSGESRTLSVGGVDDDELESSISEVRSFDEIAAEGQKHRQGFGKGARDNSPPPEGAVAKVLWQVGKIFGKRAGDPKNLLEKHAAGKPSSKSGTRRAGAKRPGAGDSMGEKRPPASRKEQQKEVASVGLVALDEEAEEQSPKAAVEENPIPDNATQWEKFVHRVKHAPRPVLFAAGLVFIGLVVGAIYLDDIISQFVEPTGMVDPNEFWVQRAESQKMDEEEGSEGAGTEDDASKATSGVDTSQLTFENVDQLGYEHLLPLMRTLRSRKDQSKRDLLFWGNYRLASSFEDKGALEDLQKHGPKKLHPEEYGPMGLAAHAGNLRMHGKGRAVLKALEKLTEAEGRKSPQILFVEAQIRNQQGDKTKALEILGKLLEKNPNMLDAQLLRARIVSVDVPPESWKAPLIDAANNSGDVDSVVRAAALLAKRGEYQELAGMLENFNSIMVANRVAPPRRDSVLSLLVAKNIVEGEFEVAESLAGRLVALNPGDIARIRTHAALKQSIGGNPLPTLDKGLARLKRSSQKLELMADRVRYQVGQKDIKGAVASLKSMVSLGKRKGKNWARYAEGIIGEGTGRTKGARIAYQKATKGRSRLPQAELALALLEGETSGADVDLLKKLVSKGQPPEARFHLGKALLKGETPAEGLAILEDLLWNRSFLGDPAELALAVSDGYSRTDKRENAEKIAIDLHETRPKDPRPLEQLLKIAEQNGDEDAAMKWTKALLPLKTPETEEPTAPPKEGANP